MSSALREWNEKNTQKVTAFGGVGVEISSFHGALSRRKFQDVEILDECVCVRRIFRLFKLALRSHQHTQRWVQRTEGYFVVFLSSTQLGSFHNLFFLFPTIELNCFSSYFAAIHSQISRFVSFCIFYIFYIHRRLTSVWATFFCCLEKFANVRFFPLS